jgi:hypothetical protein
LLPTIGATQLRRIIRLSAPRLSLTR